jgi:apolipoprotein D and lipocalin family protein
MGTWYNIERYQQPFQVGSDCIETSYDLFDNGTINIESWAKFLTNGSESFLIGTGSVSFPWLDPIPGKMNVSFYGSMSAF